MTYSIEDILKRLEDLENENRKMKIALKNLIKPKINQIYRQVYLEDLALGNGTSFVCNNEGGPVEVTEINLDNLNLDK